MSKKNDETRPQRALVLQGGGALGAYEAGVFNVLYNWIKKDLQGSENIFDIVAGTSIGAINGAILVSHVKEKRSWEGSADKLVEFWKDIKIDSNVEKDPFFTSRWQRYHRMNPNAASVEAARRYYSARQFILSGADKVFSAPHPQLDDRFFDPSSFFGTWYKYDNSKLRQIIKDNVAFPIGTSFDKNEPRLIVISVDIEEAETVAFDSYIKEDGFRRSEYGFSEKTGKNEQRVQYDQGLMVEHIMASASVPVHYDYTLIPSYYDYTKNKEIEEEKLKKGNQQNNLKGYRRFWDGGILSNTPLRELIQAHQDYWKFVEKTKEVPNLEVYIVDVWPSMDKYPLPSDYDSVVDRRNDFTYQDKTPYDEKVANIVSDYHDLSKSLIDLAKRRHIPQGDIDTILNKPAKSSHRTGEKRIYHDLLDKRFDITKLVRIERSADIDDISNKWADFSSGTISKLLKQGIDDALNSLARDVKKSKDIHAAYDQIDAFINIVKKQNIEDQNAKLIEAAENTRATLDRL